jgi:hypothetical protein
MALFDQSFLFAETYQWTDADGTVHFSDSPINAPKGKKTVVRENGSSANSSLPLRNPPPPVPLNYSQISKSPSWMQLLDSACNQEYKDATSYCEASKPVSRSENEQCVHKHVSSKCKEQFDNAYRGMQEDTVKAKKCMDMRQKIYKICGYPQSENWKCHMKYMPELEDACKNIGK